MRTDAKSILGHALVLGLRVMNSSFLLLYFFNLLLFFFSFFFFLLPFLSPFLFIFLRIIYYGFTPFPPSTCGSGVWSPFFSVFLASF